MMKRKMLIPILAVLLCVGMIGVGFAAWVIATTTTETVDEGTQFTVYDVKNQTVNFSSEFTDGSITFGTTEFVGTTNYDWITLEDDAEQDLMATLTVTIQNWTTNALSAETIVFTLSDVTISDGDHNTAFYQNYITLPAARTITITDGVLDEASANGGTPGDESDDVTLKVQADGTALLTIPMQFGWGAAFGGENPNIFYNSVDPQTTLPSATPGFVAETCDTYVEHALASLGYVYKLNDATYSVTVSADLIVD